VEIPPNVTASVHVLGARAADIYDAAGGSPASVGTYPGAAGVQEAVFRIGSGTHEFTGPAMAASGHPS
jgi:hypothetical protein